ncbi:DMT(drug/metabolite transporter) superfamily permease [Pseudomonas sp. GM50]|uniref:DMT family transporter n=1 Tax=Pseudomonas sp. GM50 TaxID=1144332 RepID=UPI000270783A|nr:EamA family transporter [Pseudomonas sp. GM50]EJM71278.1 DMT(drug/metabolite transporter) superfamily permease [Pseudomonas sp. GM50]
MGNLKKISLTDYALLLLVALIWGGNFALIKVGLEQIKPFVMSFIRFFLCVFPFVFFIPRPKIPVHILAAYGILFGGGIWGCANIAIYNGTPPGTVSLIIQLSAFITFAIGLVAFKERASKISIAALFISLAGLSLMLVKSGGGSDLVGIVTCLFAAFCFSLCTFIVQKHQPKDLLPFMIWSFLFSLPVLFILAVYFEGVESFYSLRDTINYKAIISLISQSYVTTLLGYWIWNYNIRKYSGSTVAPIGLLVPFFAIIISYIFFSYPINETAALSISLVFCGVILFNLRHKIEYLLSR